MSDRKIFAAVQPSSRRTVCATESCRDDQHVVLTAAMPSRVEASSRQASDSSNPARADDSRPRLAATRPRVSLQVLVDTGRPGRSRAHRRCAAMRLSRVLMSRRQQLAVTGVFLTALIWALGAAAAMCGVAKPGHPPVLGTPALRKDSSVLVAFGRSTDKQDLYLIFSTAACQLPQRVRPYVTLRQAPAGYPLKAASPGTVHVEVLPGELTVDIPISHSGVFKPGRYRNLVELSAPGYLTTTFTPVVVSRSENSVLWPLVLGAVGGFIGLALAGVAKVASGGRKIGGAWWRWAVVLLFALGAGAVAGWSVYHGQDIWRMSADWKGTAGAGLAAATTGSMVALLSLVGLDKAKEQRSADHPAAWSSSA
jgi:hypothetical protein